MTNQVEDILKVARSQIGYIEGKNNNSIYGQDYGMNYNDWCCMFVWWSANKAGIGADIVPKYAYVPYMQSFYEKRKRWHKKGSYRPVPGDLVIFGENDHIGIVEQVVGNTLYSIEGNTSNNGDVSNGEGVFRRTRPLNYWWITGYCHPAYIVTKDEEEDDMKYYQKISEMPDYAKPVIQKVVDKGILKGDGKGLNLSEDNMKMFVYLDRMGLIK